MLGNGLCTRPAELDCRMESACETCAYFRTSTEFLPILTRQRDHARDHGQTERPPCSSNSSNASTPKSRPLDNDHPYNAEYLLFPAAVPVLDCNYRSFNSARALIEAAARPCRASARN